MYLLLLRLLLPVLNVEYYIVEHNEAGKDSFTHFF